MQAPARGKQPPRADRPCGRKVSAELSMVTTSSTNKRVNDTEGLLISKKGFKSKACVTKQVLITEEISATTKGMKFELLGKRSL